MINIFGKDHLFKQKEKQNSSYNHKTFRLEGFKVFNPALPLRQESPVQAPYRAGRDVKRFGYWI